MTLNKKAMVREIGRRTGLKNRDVQRVIETLVEVCTEELISGGRIEIENFQVIDTKTVERASGGLLPETYVRQIKVRASKALRRSLSMKECIP